MKSRTLDLRPIIGETLDIILGDNDILKLKKPTEELVLRLSQQVNALDIPEREGETRAQGEERMRNQLDVLNQLVADVLSNNVEGKQIAVEMVERGIPLAAKAAIIQSYAEFATAISAGPNSGALPSQDGQADGLTL